MAKLTKNQKLAAEKIEAGKLYTVAEAAALVKEITTTKFDASVDIDVRLGVDPRKANQMVRGVVSLPNGTGKEVRVLALCTPDLTFLHLSEHIRPMAYLRHSHFVKSSGSFLTITAHERNCSSLLEKFGTVLYLPLLYLQSLGNMIDINILHLDY